MNPDTAFFRILLAAGALLSGGLFVFRARRRGFSFTLSAGGFALGLALAFCFAKAVYAALFGASGELWTDPERASFAAGGIGFCLGPVLVSRRRGENLPGLLDCLAVPGCLLAAFARFGEIRLGQAGLADMYTLGLPDIAEGSLPARFPFAVQDAWGIWYPAVSTLAALAALVIAAYCSARMGKRRGTAFPDGLLFERCAFLLCAVCFFLELTRMKCLIFYYVHVDQALCAAVMLLLMIHACVRRKRAAGHFPVLPLAAAVLCIVLNGLMQYMMDKPWVFGPVMPETVFRWVNDNLKPLGYSVLLLTTAVPAVVHGFLCGREKGKA